LLGEFIMHIRRGKAIPVTGHGSPWVVRSQSSHIFLGSWLTGGSEVVSITRWPPFTPRKILGAHFSWRLSEPQGHSVARRIRSVEVVHLFSYQQLLFLLVCAFMFRCEYE
jgi:hypothetical protein